MTAVDPGSVRRSRLVAVGLIALALVGCSGSGGGTSSATGPPLAPGIAAPAGVHVVSRVVPSLDSLIGDPSGEFHDGRVASLRLDQSARPVYGRLSAAATRHGYSGLPPASSACHDSRDRGPAGAGGRDGGRLTTCSGRGARADGTNLEVELASCDRCEEDFRLGRVATTSDRPSPAPDGAHPIDVTQQPGPSDPAAWAEIPGTTVIQEGWYYACQGNLQVDLKVTGNPEAAWRAALAAMGAVDAAAAVTYRGGEVRQASTGLDGTYEVVVLDLGAEPDPVLHFWTCED